MRFPQLLPSYAYIRTKLVHYENAIRNMKYSVVFSIFHRSRIRSNQIILFAKIAANKYFSILLNFLSKRRKVYCVLIFLFKDMMGKSMGGFKYNELNDKFIQMYVFISRLQ